jgi:predicted unusual protein kinase regulating ubiquinone biosynthesis (AarF/ABC1/UbiB family)
LVRRHGLRLPGALVQVFKALGMCEGILQAIDPESSLLGAAEPICDKAI